VLSAGPSPDEPPGNQTGDHAGHPSLPHSRFPACLRSMARRRPWPFRTARFASSCPSRSAVPPDVGARVLAETMTPHLAHPIVVENRVGAPASSPPGWSPARRADALRQHLPRRAAPNAPIDVTTAPVSVLSEMPTVMPAANNFPARGVREFIALARPNPSPPCLGRTL
jgi:hypothetical protein